MYNELIESQRKVIPTTNVNIVGKWRKDLRECERFNHIPHVTPTKNNRDEWNQIYLNPLLAMHSIVADTINERYPKNKIRWDTDRSKFNALCKLIYHCSSKHICDCDRLDTENISKDCL